MNDSVMFFPIEGFWEMSVTPCSFGKYGASLNFDFHEENLHGKSAKAGGNFRLFFRKALKIKLVNSTNRIVGMSCGCPEKAGGVFRICRSAARILS